MNPAICQQATQSVGDGVAASLRAVDCAAGEMTQEAFGRLFGSEGALLPALTILLTLYVAFFAFSLITGRSSIGINALTPRMLTLGLVLTFATSWLTFQSVVWNLAVGAPDQIAGILTGSQGSATEVFAQKIDVVFAAIAQAAGNSAEPSSTFSPPGLMWLGSTLLLLGTVGVLVTAKIALAVLIAVGPIFMVLALFAGTRGLFVGWLKGAVLLALAPLFAVLAGTLMLELSVPVIGSLAAVPGEIDARAAMAFFMVGAVHVALMVMAMKIAGTMVAGWTVFGLASRAEERSTSFNSSSTAPRSEAPRGAPASAQPELSPQRRIAISGIPAGAAANDLGSTGGASRSTTRIVTTGDRRESAAASSTARSRAHGIGSRFRAAPQRSTEKIK